MQTSTLTSALGTAGAGTLILEFATLSRLTGDDRFEKAAYNAFFALWDRRSDIGLVGNTIDVTTGVSRTFRQACVLKRPWMFVSYGQTLRSLALALELIPSTNML
jgi:Glycosyl hydrolase family 47